MPLPLSHHPLPSPYQLLPRSLPRLPHHQLRKECKYVDGRLTLPVALSGEHLSRGSENFLPQAQRRFVWISQLSSNVSKKFHCDSTTSLQNGIEDPTKKKMTASVFLVCLKACLILFGVGAFFTFQYPAFADFGKPAVDFHRVIVLETLNSGWTGFMAGCLHTLTGLDHLAALTPLCIGRTKLDSALVGALWGCGHDAGQVIFGLIFLLLKGKLKIELLQAWASRIVGFTLLVIGVVGLKESQEVPVSVLATEGVASVGTPEIVADQKNNQKWRMFATGLVYGLQPDALIMVLPALALPSRLAGAAYLGMFLLGTVVSMSSYTAFIGSCGEALQKQLPWITYRLSIGSSIIAILFGVGILLGELMGIKIL